MKRFAVGEPVSVPMIGEGRVTFYPIIDADTAEQITCFPLYRDRDHAEREVYRYNGLYRETYGGNHDNPR